MSSLQIHINPTPKQHLAWQKYQDKTTSEILVGGAAGGGKSRIICEAIASSALRYPSSRWLLGRSVLKTLKQTTLLTLFEVLTAWLCWLPWSSVPIRALLWMRYAADSSA